MNKFVIAFLLIPSIAFGYSYPSVPNAFVPGTTISSAKVNANFSSIITGMSSGAYKTNFAELYVAGTRLSDSSRNLKINNLNVSGNIVLTGTFTTTTINGTLLTPDQKYITHTGTLTTLNVTGAVKMASTLAVTGLLTGTLGTASQPNITQTGTLVTLNVTGALKGTLATADQPNITHTGTLSTLNVTGALKGTLVTADQLNITHTGTLTTLNVTGIQKNADFLRFNTQKGICANTVDGSDTAVIIMSGGGYWDVSGGGNIYLSGNEASTAKGSVQITPGLGNNTNSCGTTEIWNPDGSLIARLGLTTNKKSILTTFSGGLIAATINATSGITGTLQTAAQTNITSLGTLTALQVDNLNMNGNAITSTSGSVDITPLSGQNLNVTLATTGDFAVNTNQLYVDTSAGNVGIGTASPAAKLDISAPSSGEALRVTGYTNNWTSRMTGSSVTGQSYGAAIAAGTNSSDRSFQVSNYGDSAQYLVVRGDGYVGIGTTSPATTLDVNGSIKVATDIYTVAKTDYFATSTKTGWAATPTGAIYYKKVGSLVFVQFWIMGTSNGTSTSFTITPSPGAIGTIFSSATVKDNGTTKTSPGRVSNSNTAATIDIYTDMAGGGWTNSGTKEVYGQFFYTTD